MGSFFVPHKYSEATKKTTKGTMDEYLEKLEGACARTLDPSIKKGKADDPAVDRENQHVVPVKTEVKQSKKTFEGNAVKVRSIPADATQGKLQGRFIIQGTSDTNYSEGTTVTLAFQGIINGVEANLKQVEAVVTKTPTKGQDHIIVQFSSNQEVIDINTGNTLYLRSNNAITFKVKIK